jgi:hypothetical protein
MIFLVFVLKVYYDKLLFMGIIAYTTQDIKSIA